MNIFYLSNSAHRCAEMHCDKHVLKMIIEYAQLLSTAHHVLDGENAIQGIYKKTHTNHPCAKWVREASGNYHWLYLLFENVCDEYTFRYSKIHKTSEKLVPLASLPYNIPEKKFFEPPLCMPDECKVEGDVVQSYRNYYLMHKARFATWKNTTPPKWFDCHK